MGQKLADDATNRINGYNTIGICYNIATQNGEARRGYKYTPFFRKALLGDEPGFDTDDAGLLKFFNDPTVQKQLNVNTTKWAPCSDSIGNAYTYGNTTIPLFESFKKAGLKILLYSGNVDAVVPYVLTEQYIRQLGWKETKAKTGVKNPRGSL